MSIGVMPSLLTSNEPNGSFPTSSSSMNPTFQPPFPLPPIPDMTFSQANEVSMTSFPMFMNGTYSHDLKQLSLLQECTKLLEGQVMKLVLENTTLRTTFQYLAGAIGLHDVDPCQVDGTSFLQASTSLKLKVEPAPMTPNDYPLGQTSKQGTMGFLEDKDSKPPSCETVKAICRLLHGGWVELVHQELAPPSAYPNFKLANNGWKLDYLASITYPAWWKGTLDDNSKWKQKKGKWPKIEDEDENDSTDEVGMKWKGVAFKSEGGPWKHFKGEHKEEDDPPSDKSTTSFEASTTLLSALMCTSPTNTDHNVEAPPSLSSPLCDQVEESIQCDLDTDPNAVSINQLTALALAASKA
ncbi:hypothetical protein EDD16DRAFT_1720035 [Pisolithus croceorrhizus]|nr:hypothetical protein EDD16DRAFT_1720035 [Pisolithus croceorrhizus]KAI6137919.1 hypothetical protein EDD17DRAFT_1771150 [Pisolithus thermaeus]